MTTQLDPQAVLDDYIIPAAQALGIYTLPHLQIGFDTAAQESGFQDEVQEGGGPALGPWQMEPDTHDSLWNNFIAYRPAIKAALAQILGGIPLPPPADTVMSNLVYGAAMMFCRYLDAPGAIPADLNGQAAYYLKNYNAGGKATLQEYLDNHARFAPQVTFPDIA